MTLRAAGVLLLCLIAPPFGGHSEAAETSPEDFACRPVTCSTLLPAAPAEDRTTDDCAYRNRNAWWLDYIAAPLAWSTDGPREPVTVAVFDDGADIEHIELRNQLWTNVAEARGQAGVDDDANGYIDDIHGWDFVDNDPVVSPEGECRGRPSHGTFMASLIAAERNNGAGIAAAGSDGARVMIVRIAGCGRHANDRADPARLRDALYYATRMGAKILSFSAHWFATTEELDRAFADIAGRPDSEWPAIIVASVPNRGEPAAGYPAAYPFRRIVRAVPISDDDIISPGTSPAPPGLNFGAPAACIIGASAAPAGFRVGQGSSNSAAILAGLLAGIWSSPPYAKFTVDEFLARVVHGRMSQTSRRSKPGPRAPYLEGVPLADACLLATPRQSANVCHQPGLHREPRP